MACAAVFTPHLPFLHATQVLMSPARVHLPFFSPSHQPRVREGSLQPSVSTWALVTFRGQVIPWGERGDCPVLYVSSTLGLYLLGANSIHLLARKIKTVSRHCRVLPPLLTQMVKQTNSIFYDNYIELKLV